MCGRYVLFGNPELQEIRKIMEEVQRKVNGEIKMGEIFPTDKAPVLVRQQEQITPELFSWGFPNFRNKGVIINARAETVQEKPMFRRCLPSRRCVIPSSGFYEWTHDGKKVKYRFNLPGTDALYMAGLYQEFEGEKRFVILTTNANRSMEDVHNRMPVVLDVERKEQWLEDTQRAMDILAATPPLLIKTPA